MKRIPCISLLSKCLYSVTVSFFIHSLLYSFPPQSLMMCAAKRGNYTLLDVASGGALSFGNTYKIDSEKDARGRTALMQLARHGHEKIIDDMFCSKWRYVLKVEDNDGNNAVMHAILKGHKRIAEIFLRREVSDIVYYPNRSHADLSIDLEHKNKQGKNILMLLAEKGLLGKCDSHDKLLYYTDVNACDNEGNTALILAARNGHDKVVKFLLDRWDIIDLYAKNKAGDSAFVLAIEKSRSLDYREKERALRIMNYVENHQDINSRLLNAVHNGNYDQFSYILRCDTKNLTKETYNAALSYAQERQDLQNHLHDYTMMVNSLNQLYKKKKNEW